MRDALGALGPVKGDQPELTNLTVAMTIVEKGDIVFLTSDGVSDNFDPVVGKFAVPMKNNVEGINVKPDTKSPDPKIIASESPRKTYQGKPVTRSNSNPERDSTPRPTLYPKLPVVTAEQRHMLALLRMEDILTNGMVGDGQTASPCTSAKRLCELLIDFSTKLTVAKRRILEDPELYSETEGFTQIDQRYRRRLVGEKLVMVPGKLDHCSAVAFKVGFYGDYAGKRFEVNGDDGRKYNLKLKASLAKVESTDLQDSFF